MGGARTRSDDRITHVWCTYYVADRMGMSYLAKQNVERYTMRSPSRNTDGDEKKDAELESLELQLSSEELHEEDTTVLQPPLHNPNIHIYDYHVLYSTSYATPVLYFRARHEGT